MGEIQYNLDSLNDTAYSHNVIAIDGAEVQRTQIIHKIGVTVMKVIFIEDIPNLANAGEIKNVSAGYARNYLLPKKLAIMATNEEMKRIQRIKSAGDGKRLKETEHMEELGKLLEGTEVTLTARSTPNGNFYGAIGPSQIIQEISNVSGRELTRKMFGIIEPIREPGEYPIVLNLGHGVHANITVTAESEGDVTKGTE